MTIQTNFDLCLHVVEPPQESLSEELVFEFEEGWMAEVDVEGQAVEEQSSSSFSEWSDDSSQQTPSVDDEDSF